MYQDRSGSTQKDPEEPGWPGSTQAEPGEPGSTRKYPDGLTPQIRTKCQESTCAGCLTPCDFIDRFFKSYANYCVPAFLNIAKKYKNISTLFVQYICLLVLEKYIYILLYVKIFYNTMRSIRVLLRLKINI